MASVSGPGKVLARPRALPVAERPSSPVRTGAKVVGAGVAVGGGLTALGGYGLARPFSASASAAAKTLFSTQGIFTKEGLMVAAVISAVAMAVIGGFAWFTRSINRSGEQSKGELKPKT